MVIKTLYVTDTHAFIWYLLDNLPKKVDDIFKSVEKGESTIFVPTIVLAESLHLVENKKIDLNFDDLLKKIEMSKNFVPTSFNFQIMKILPELGIKELHDRIIIATAKILNAKLITKDKEIKKAGIVETVW
ncbi:MAG TPA: PIN domain-containing protein [Candidatus Atribacteria bacterium]|nr:PIN domain-containing protein [Candidatus Atribacteria bacterium]